MHITYIVSQFPSLTETFVAREIAEVARFGHDVTVCVLRPLPQRNGPAGLDVDGVRILRMKLNAFSLLAAQVHALLHSPIQYLQCWIEATIASIRKPSRTLHLVYLLVAAAWFAQHLGENQLEYIHAHFLHTEAVAARWLALLRQVPYGITAHVSSIRLGKALLRRAVSQSRVLVGDTAQTLQVYQSLCGRSAKLIRNGIDLANLPFRPQGHGQPGDEGPVILAVGSLLPPKGFDVLIQACAILYRQGTKFRCRIIGDGPERRKLKELIQANALQAHVELPGAVKFTALRDEYMNASLFVMPSIPSSYGSDGLPTVLIEAMAVGIPIVATRHAGIPDLVRHRETGLLASPSDADDLAMCIQELLSDQSLRQQLTIHGRQVIEAEYDIKRNVQVLTDLMINSVVQTRRVGSTDRVA